MARFLGTGHKAFFSGCVGVVLAFAAQSAFAQHHGGHHMGSSMHHGGSYSGHSGHHHSGHHHSGFGGLYLGGLGGYGGFGGMGLGYGGYGNYGGGLGYNSLYGGLGYGGLGYSGLGYGGAGYSRYSNPYNGYYASPYRYQSTLTPMGASTYAIPTYGNAMPPIAAPVVRVQRSAMVAARPGTIIDPSDSSVVLRPGMVLSDGATVISVDPIK